MSSDSQLFLDTFTLTSHDSSQYDRVARIKGTSTDGQTTFLLDINTDLYRLSEGEQIELSLVSTLNLDGSKDDEKGTWRDKSGESTLADLWQYVCYGKVYRFEEGEESPEKGGREYIKMYASFGGLLLFIEGPYKKLTSLRVDDVYLLLRK
ncbi:hypothetical protein FKW77_004332 [Venturia effusa]|uniref:DNA-directed RNA polymerases I, II, and III subunit RPABC3 n=1 Tax=Venturia effusa TaxID=50376 RepID=A0A517LC89_9PEZI|nr:hypothetical protein FKW77_004332 [Venturia effusa]